MKYNVIMTTIRNWMQITTLSENKRRNRFKKKSTTKLMREREELMIKLGKDAREKPELK